MTVIYEREESVYEDRPHWERRTVNAYSPYTYRDKEKKRDEFSVEKSQYGVDIEFQTDEGNFTRSFTSDEFEEFVRQCQWVSQCKVEQK